MTKVREIKWPEEFSDLKRMEELMVCGICYDYMETSVITPCSHNYCSLCIRKYLHYKAQCPACFHVFFEKDLYVNRTMDVLIQYYIQIREMLINLIQNRIIYNTAVQQEEETPSTPPVRPARNTHFLKSPKKLDTKLSESEPPSVKSPFASTSKCNTSSPSATKSPKVIPSIPKMFNTPKRSETIMQLVTTKTSTNANTNTVSCPVCSVDIPADHINMHLDACLKREVAQETCKEKVSVPKRPLMPKLVLRVMKDAELRKKMKEYGLSTQGDRRTLENRFTKYSTIYNAECDKLEPRPVAELIRQCEMEEKQERKMDNYLVSMTELNRLQIERNAKKEKIEEAQKKYREVNKSSFDKLIEEVRNRRKQQMAKEQDGETSSSTSKPSTSVSTENPSGNISENEENASFNPSAEIAFQDTDSDESCPLQHYRSDGPMKFVSGNLNDFSPCTSTASSPSKRSQSVFVKNNEAKDSKDPEKASCNPYEVSTDVSTDDDIPSSPILNKNPNSKRVKLSKKSLKKSISFTSSVSRETTNSIQQEDREAVARSLCNSIINDFTFDGLTDDSSNEFANKLKAEESKKIESSKNSNSLEDGDSLNKSKLQKENNFTCDKKVPEEDVNGAALLNSLHNLHDDFSFDILNGDSSNDFINASSTSFKATAKQMLNESAVRLNDKKLEKENDALSANENSQPSTNENIMRRPLRKRNRPARFSATAEQEVLEKVNNHVDDESHDSESPDNLCKSVSSDGSLKRRRGRSKACSKNHPSDDTQNPPKRPVRRRQAVSDRNLS